MADDPKISEKDNGEHARYLSDPDTGHVELIPKEDVVDKVKDGWKEPEVLRANGYEYNREEDQLQIDAAGESLSARRKWQAEQDAEKEKERQKVEDEAKKAQEKSDADAAKAQAKPAPAPVAPVVPANPPAAS